MRIIGGHDYYDSALGFGHDENVFYVRGQQTLSVKEARQCGILPSQLIGRFRQANLKRERSSWNTASYDIKIKGVEYTFAYPTVIVCGKRYQGIRVCGYHCGTGDSVHYYWHLDKFTDWMSSLDIEYKDPNYFSMLRSERFSERDLLDIYFDPEECSKSLMNLLAARKWTLLVHNPENFHHDRDNTPWLIDQAVLKEVEFAKVLHPTIMFQEIDMWLSGRIGGHENMMVQISNDVRAAKHGMDKTSFRKPPQIK